MRNFKFLRRGIKQVLIELQPSAVCFRFVRGVFDPLELLTGIESGVAKVFTRKCIAFFFFLFQISSIAIKSPAFDRVFDFQASFPNFTRICCFHEFFQNICQPLLKGFQSVSKIVSAFFKVSIFKQSYCLGDFKNCLFSFLNIRLRQTLDKGELKCFGLKGTAHR